MSTKGLTKHLINKFSILNGAKHFSSGIFQNCLVFIPTKKYIRFFSGTTHIDWRKSNGVSEENIENVIKSDSNFTPTFVDHHVLPCITFNGHCLINIIYMPKSVINLYISYTLNPQLRTLNTDFTLGNRLLGSVKLTKNAYLVKYKYSCYDIGFDSLSEILFTDRSMAKNFVSFGTDMSSSVLVNNKAKNILFLGEGLTKN